MKILMLTPYLPYPLYSGGQIRSYNLLKNLSKKHQITLFSFIRQPEERTYLKQLTKFCYKVKVFKRRKPWDPRNIGLALLTPYPFLVAIYLSRKFRQAIQAELSREKYDLIHAETFYVLPNLPKNITIPTLLVEQTIEYLVYQRFFETTKLIPLKPILYLDVLKIRVWEKYYWNHVTHLAAMSQSDKNFMQEQTPRKVNIDVVANGVDLAYFAKIKFKPQPQPTVLFVGNFKWLPNREAATFLVQDIWPLITQELAKARLLIVGRHPTQEIKNLSRKNIQVLADVDDIRQVISQSDVMLAPIRNGRGTKYKVLEAMASGLAVVTTKLGIEGIEADQAVMVGETASQLAQLTIKVLTNKTLSQDLSQRAKKIVKNKYNWQIISQHLDQIYQQLGQTAL